MNCQEVVFSGHAVRRMFARGISAADIEQVVAGGERIEEYPDDEPLPSCLLLGFVAPRALHVVVGHDGRAGRCVIISVYWPDTERWDRGFSVEEDQVICTACRSGETQTGTTTVTMTRGECTIIVKGVPAEVCSQCDEYYLAAAVTERILGLGEEAVARGAEVEVLRWAA